MGNESSSQTSSQIPDAVVASSESSSVERTDETDARVIKEFYGSPELETGKAEVAKLIKPELYEYPFENLCLEGGGCKGVAYAGVLKCLEDYGIIPNMKRFCGASAGAMAATMFALGYTSEEMKTLMATNLQPLFEDAGVMPWTVYSNIKDQYGWNPAQKFYDWMSETIAAKTTSGKADLTFHELYLERGVELCIVVTNINVSKSQRCHPKTTPDMPIRDAVRMSMSIPLYFEAKFYSPPGINQKDVFVDGGVLNNYPIDSFDGWGLSMDPENAFVKKLKPMDKIRNMLKKQFDDFNPKTMGCILYSDGEKDILRYNLAKREGAELPKDPKAPTKLHNKVSTERKQLAGHIYCYNEKIAAVNAFLDALESHEDGDQAYISKEQLARALRELSHTKKAALFGEKQDVDSVMSSFDKSGDGNISLYELVYQFEQIGLKVRETIYGFGRKKIDGLLDFTNTLYNCVSMSLAENHLKVGDETRTVGINTGHVGTLDFDLEDADREFAIDRGYNSTEAFLRYFAAEKKMCLKESECVKRKNMTDEELEGLPDVECKCTPVLPPTNVSPVPDATNEPGPDATNEPGQDNTDDSLCKCRPEEKNGVDI